MLLVLDNCEHVIDEAASLAETIFRQAPDVHILATSREALRVEGEHAYPPASARRAAARYPSGSGGGTDVPRREAVRRARRGE